MKKAIILSFLFTLYFGVASAQDDSSKNNLYPVKVHVKEVKNRTLECSVRNHKVIVDQPKEFGADNLGPTPVEMLAVSYGSCVASTIQFLAKIRNIEVSEIDIVVEGIVDFSKAMGVSDKNRSGFPEFNLTIKFKSNLSKNDKEKFIADVFKVGSAIDNVDNITPIKYKIISD